jgi:hypothetical protein
MKDTLGELTSFVIACASLVAAIASILSVRTGKKNATRIAEVHELANATNSALTARNEQLTVSMSEQGGKIPPTPNKE